MGNSSSRDYALKKYENKQQFKEKKHNRRASREKLEGKWRSAMAGLKPVKSPEAPSPPPPEPEEKKAKPGSDNKQRIKDIMSRRQL